MQTSASRRRSIFCPIDRWLPAFLIAIGGVAMLVAAPKCQANWQDSVEAAPRLSVEIKQQGDHSAMVRVGEDLFVTLDATNFGKPILWPLMGPGQIRMTRQWPMETVPGEAHDHPHHKGVWWAHGIVNGADFWVEKDPIKNQKLTIESHSIRLENHWEHQDQVLLTEHLSDRQLYCLILRDILPAQEKRVGLDDSIIRWQCLDPVEDEESWLRYYATVGEREQWADETGLRLPPKQELPFPRIMPQQRTPDLR